MKQSTFIAQIIGFIILLVFANSIPTNYLLVILIGYVGLLFNLFFLLANNVEGYIAKKKDKAE